MTGFEDWFPTLLELSGSTNQLPKNLDGISFAPTLIGKTQAERPFLYREFHGVGGQQAVRAGDWKLVRRNLLGTRAKPAAPTTELYDLTNDPVEAKNVAAENPAVLARLEALLREQHQPSPEFPIPALDQLPGRK